MLKTSLSGVLAIHFSFFFINAREKMERGYPDFIVYYSAANIVRNGLGHQLYNLKLQQQFQTAEVGKNPDRSGPLPFIHPPFEALLFLPLSYFSYLHAFALWNLLNLYFLFCWAKRLRAVTPSVRRFHSWQVMLCLLAFFPIFDCFLQGQDSILQLLLCSLGFEAWKRDRNIASGAWFGLAMFKFQFILPIVLIAGLWKSKRFILSFSCISASLVLASAAVTGWKNVLAYPGFVLHIANSPGQGGVPPAMAPNLRGLTFGLLSAFPFELVVGLCILIPAVLILSAMKPLFQASPSQAILRTSHPLQFALAVLVSGLMAWQTNMHDWTLMALPIALLAEHIWREGISESPSHFWKLVLPLFPLMVSPLWLGLWLGMGAINLIAIPILLWALAIRNEIARCDSQPINLSAASEPFSY